jgi:hypothetical protein
MAAVNLVDWGKQELLQVDPIAARLLQVTLFTFRL